MIKGINEKQNQQQLVNKKTDLLSSLYKIKLPIHTSLYYKQNQL